MPGLFATLQATPTGTLALYAGILLALVVLARDLRSWYRLRHIPGPVWASFSITWLVTRMLGGRYHEHMRQIHETYGPLVRIGPNDLLCCDPDTLRRINGAHSLYTKGEFYETGRIIPGTDNVVSLRDEDGHRALRAKMTTAYSARENEGFTFEPGVDRQVTALIALIESKYVSGATHTVPFDMTQKSQFFALDVIGDVSFGGAFGFLREDRDLYRYIEINDSSIPVMNLLGVVPGLVRLVHRWPLRLLLPSDGDQFGFGRLMGVARSFVDERMGGGGSAAATAGPHKDMMQALVKAGMTRAELLQHTFVQMVAGSISTAHALRMTLLCLVSNPAAYARLRAELDAAAAAAGRLPGPVVPLAAARALPYLQAVVREGLRMYPPVAGLGSKTVPPGGDADVCGFAVPAGAQLGHGFFGLARARALWGDDADVFRPERWLPRPGEDADRAARRARDMARVVDLAFGSGRYQCLGKPIALMELNKVLVELMRRYDFAVFEPLEPLRAWCAVFWVATDMRLRITRREDAAR